jgi:hypothetical protein
MPAKTPLRLMIAFSAISLAAIVAAVAYRTWPRPLPYSLPSALPFASLRGDHVAIQYPAPVVIARVGDYQDELLAYLHFEYLRSRSVVDEPRVLLTVKETSDGPRYQLQLAVENDLLATVPYLADLAAQDFIPHFHLYTTTTAQYAYLRAETRLFLAAYNLPVRQKLETMSPGELISPVARFLYFKSSIDPRVRQAGALSVSSLSSDQATQMAADVVAVASFYHLPLDFFLGIGAMENNYLSVDGDLEHAVWKKHAARGDIVLKRRRGRVLVRNYSIGAWQITRETLRYAHALYLRDKRDYSALPERLRPPATLDLEAIDQHVLTTYAGLLFRDLLDRFDGDVQKAVGAYNGGVKNPNLEYSAGVEMVATYARKILEQVVAQSGQSVAHVELAMRKAPHASKAGGNQNQPPSTRPESADP